MPLDAAFLHMTYAQSILNHVNGIEVLKGVLSALRDIAVNILDQTTNFFGWMDGWMLFSDTSAQFRPFSVLERLEIKPF